MSSLIALVPTIHKSISKKVSDVDMPCLITEEI